MFRADADELGGKIALVTGGTQGVGAAILARLAAESNINGCAHATNALV